MDLIFYDFLMDLPYTFICPLPYFSTSSIYWILPVNILARQSLSHLNYRGQGPSPWIYSLVTSFVFFAGHFWQFLKVLFCKSLLCPSSHFGMHSALFSVLVYLPSNFFHHAFLWLTSPHPSSLNQPALRQGGSDPYMATPLCVSLSLFTSQSVTFMETSTCFPY